MIHTEVLKRSFAYFEEKKCGNTVREILQQPRLWNELADYLLENRGRIAAFMERVLATPGLRIVFTGAGSSAFIGESLQNILAAELGIRAETVHTTDIVSAPDCVLHNVPTLLISYSRSGESPESVGAIRYAEKKIDTLYNIIIVCKKNSSLANFSGQSDHTLVLDMPPESSDLGFAMTSSVSCMALATWCVFGWKQLEERAAYLRVLADSLEPELGEIDARAREIAGWEYSRVIFLGSGNQRGLARESAVKSLELTNGQVNASYDSAAGFRHGPKTAVVDGTLTVHYISSDPFTGRYDMDLLTEMVGEKNNNRIVAVLARDVHPLPDGVDSAFCYAVPDPARSAISDYIKGLVFAQLLSVEKSLQCGLPTDSPCVGGQVNRVVQGVVVYEL